jgi:hypothetical protein
MMQPYRCYFLNGPKTLQNPEVVTSEPRLQIITRYLAKGTLETRFYWLGDARAPVRIGADNLKEYCKEYGRIERALDRMPSQVQIGPFILRLVAEDDSPFCLLYGYYLRQDTGLLNWLRYAADARFGLWAERMQVRVVVSLAIWGLAEIPESEAPRWSHTFPCVRRAWTELRERGKLWVSSRR